MKKFKTHWDGPAAALDEAARVLPEMLRHYFEQGDRVVRPKTSDKQLHEFRLATKRARYTLELFEPLFGATLKPHLDVLKRVQQVLGQMNDCTASLELIDDLDMPADSAWTEAIKLRRDKKRGEFAELWLDEVSSEAQREALISALASHTEPGAQTPGRGHLG